MVMVPIRRRVAVCGSGTLWTGGGHGSPAACRAALVIYDKIYVAGAKEQSSFRAALTQRALLLPRLFPVP